MLFLFDITVFFLASINIQKYSNIKKKQYKIQLVSIWYDLSDVQTEEMVNDSLRAMKFYGLAIEDSVPYKQYRSRFRSELT